MRAADAVLTLTRTGRRVFRFLPEAAMLLALWDLERGGFNHIGDLGWEEAAIVGLLLGGIGFSTVIRVRRARTGAPGRVRDDLELGGALIGTTYLVVCVGGPPLFPLVYLLMAFLVSFFPRKSGLGLLGIAIAFDAATTLRGSQQSLIQFLNHATFFVLFAGLYHVILAARLAVAKKAEQEAVKNRIREAEERARTFRLVNAGSQENFSSAQDQEKWLLASVKEVEGAVGAALEIAEVALETHTCAAFLLTPDDRHLKLYDCRSASEQVQREPLPAGEGILGGVVRRGIPVRMHSPRGIKSVGHYDRGGPQVGALLAVPIQEGTGLVRGVLLADRKSDRPFSDNDERLLCTIAGEVLRAIEVERVMGYIRKTRDEKDRFFRAIEELNRAGNPEQVFVAVLESARQLASLDFCAITLVNEQDGKRFHRVARILGVAPQGKALEGKVFLDNNGLVANVVRYGAPLPGRELKSMDKQVIFDDDTQIRGLGALKIFPLSAGDRILGTLVAGSRKKSTLEPDALRMLEVMAIQAAQAVLRAQLFHQMETMATTDGLTGLLNHRMFQTRIDEILAHARRYDRKCSVLLCDIDHFKSVNDTYGHPVGDLVLSGVARILREMARDTDVVARYGGEEFAIVMPETDAKGAWVIAERIREAVRSQVFQTEVGPIKVTLSLGISSLSAENREKQVLIDLADQCLYQAKRQGRNRTVTDDQLGRKALGADRSRA